MPSYWVATHQDLMLSGLTPSACRPDARALSGINLWTGVFQLDGHGFAGGEPVRFEPQGEPGPQGPRLPSGLVAGTWYAVAPTNDDPDFFKLSPLLRPSDSGIGRVSVIENYIAKIDAQMAAWTSVLLAKAVAYKPPWLTPPTWAPMMVAKLAAPTVAAVLRVSSDRYPVPEIATGYEWALKELKFLEEGGTYSDGTGPIDADGDDGTYDVARASNSVQDGHVQPMRWVTGYM